MNTRYNYVRPKRRDSSKDDVFYQYRLEKIIKPISFNKDNSVKDYVEVRKWKKEKCSWKEFVDSYDIGSVSDQVLSHLKKGTPLLTAHTLPPGDYTHLERDAKIRKELAEKGYTLEMIISAFKEANKSSEEKKVEEKVEENKDA